MGIEGETIYEMKAFIERVSKFKKERQIQKLHDFRPGDRETERAKGEGVVGEERGGPEVVSRKDR